MKHKWYIVIPFGKGYLGTCAEGQIYGTDRMEVISHLLRIAFA